MQDNMVCNQIVHRSTTLSILCTHSITTNGGGLMIRAMDLAQPQGPAGKESTRGWRGRVYVSGGMAANDGSFFWFNRQIL
jgi:hypothetical protein